MEMLKHTEVPFFLIAFLLLITQFVVLFSLGQPVISASGEIKVWEGVVLSAENSQQVTDWYSFTHVFHGLLFYALTKLCFPRWPVVWRLLLALGVEMTWEIIENTPIVIQHYRQQALSLGYTGDSIINSLSDSIAMLTGFCIAWRFPTWVVICVALGLELWLAYEIRDNFTLNIINLIYAFPSIKVWQAAGAIV